MNLIEYIYINLQSHGDYMYIKDYIVSDSQSEPNEVYNSHNWIIYLHVYDKER